MDDFQKAVIDTLNKMVAVQERTDARIEKVAGHWDRAEERSLRAQEINERHLSLRERESAEKFAQEVHAEAVRLVNRNIQGITWALDTDARASLRKRLDEIDADDKERQERKAQREANSNTTGTSVPQASGE